MGTILSKTYKHQTSSLNIERMAGYKGLTSKRSLDAVKARITSLAISVEHDRSVLFSASPLPAFGSLGGVNGCKIFPSIHPLEGMLGLTVDCLFQLGEESEYTIG